MAILTLLQIAPFLPSLGRFEQRRTAGQNGGLSSPSPALDYKTAVNRSIRYLPKARPSPSALRSLSTLSPSSFVAAPSSAQRSFDVGGRDGSVLQLSWWKQRIGRFLFCGGAPPAEASGNGIGKAVASAILVLTLAFNAASFIAPPNPPPLPPVRAADGAAIGFCLLKQRRVPLLRSSNAERTRSDLRTPHALTLATASRTKLDSQTQRSDIFENDAVGEFNECAVRDKGSRPSESPTTLRISCPRCVPPRNSYRSSTKRASSIFRWYVTAGQDELFDVFPCPAHFFTETAPEKFYGKKINLAGRGTRHRILSHARTPIRRFVQDPSVPPPV